MKTIFVAIDGDDIGSKTEYYMLTDQLDSLRTFSESFEASFRWLQNTLENEMNAYIIFSGGDNLLAKIESYARFKDDLKLVMARFQEQSGCSLSIGLGTNTTEAYLSLKLAKVSGKNRVCQYGEEGLIE